MLETCQDVLLSVGVQIRGVSRVESVRSLRWNWGGSLEPGNLCHLIEGLVKLKL